MQRRCGAVLPVVGQPLEQCLLGFEAQGCSLARLLEAAGITALFLPAPEIFHSPESLLSLQECWAGDRTLPTEILHVRLGMVRAARILHGARNVAIVAERQDTDGAEASEHPFADGNVLPAAMRHALTYGQPTTLRRPDGTPVPTTTLPAFLVTADLAGVTRQPAPGEAIRRGGIRGLDVASLAELETRRLHPVATWEGSTDFRRLVAKAGSGVPVVLLPWNLAHAGSIVPDLLGKLASLAHDAAPPWHLVLCPYNVPAAGPCGLHDAIDGFMRRCVDPDAARRQVFVARLRQCTEVLLLRQIVSVAWLDEQDPEHEWTRARLAAIGIPLVILASPTDRTAGAADARVILSERISVRTNDAFGERVSRGYTMASRDLPALIGVSRRGCGVKPVALADVTSPCPEVLLPLLAGSLALGGM